MSAGVPRPGLGPHPRQHGRGRHGDGDSLARAGLRLIALPPPALVCMMTDGSEGSTLAPGQGEGEQEHTDH